MPSPSYKEGSDIQKISRKNSESSSKIGENIFMVNENDDSPLEEKRAFTPLVQPIESKPPLSKQGRPQSASDKIVTHEKELEMEIIDLKKIIYNLESQLNLKQEEIYHYEKLEKQNNFAKVECEALDKAKTQLREAYHKIELFKIETEELIRQVDYTETRVKDLEAENINLKIDIERREKIADERLKLTESRILERTIKEKTREFEIEKEENLRIRKDIEIENTQLKSENLQLEGENRELRSKIWSLRDQEEKIKELEQENYLMSQRLYGERGTEKPKELVTESIQKELHTQEQLIQGYQKENEKLMSEIRSLKAQMKDERLRILNEDRKVDLLKSNLIKDHGGILIKENISDIESINALAGGTVINKEDYIALKENLTRVTREIMEKEKDFKEKELELYGQIEKLKKYKNDAENSQNIKKNNFNENKVEDEKKEYQKEIEYLKERLTFYMDNSEGKYLKIVDE